VVKLRATGSWILGWSVLAGVGGLSLGCGETTYDLHLKAMKHETEVARGPCRLEHAGDSQVGNFMAAVALSGDQLASCLNATKENLAMYDRIAAMGYEDANFKAGHTRAKERVEKLSQMLENVRHMERMSQSTAPQ